MNCEFTKISDVKDITELISSDKLDKTTFHCLESDVPKKCLNEPCILGVDEAGRGPVLGPMVYAVCYCPLKEVAIIKTIGCTDSKALTEKKREEIFQSINSCNDDIGWAADIISPNYISNKMLKRTKYSLNEIAYDSTINLIKSVFKKNINVIEIYVDTVGPPEKYQKIIEVQRIKLLSIMSHDTIYNSGIQKASEMKNTTKLSTGSANLDRFFFGGLPVKGITELCGESGSGKSQLCMQLALSVQLPQALGGLNGGAIYICSEELFQSKRLYQLIDKFKNISEKKIEFSNNVYVLHVADYSSLENSFKKILRLVHSHNIKLLVLDSITALFRGNSLDGGGRNKALELRTIAKNFYHIHKKYGMMIVVVNQVSECSGVDNVPALGLAWANLVTTRIMLKKNEMTRTLEVIFSPVMPHLEIQFKIDQSGVDACQAEARLSKLFPHCEITVKQKADSLYPVVGAASICAKVIRDIVVQSWKFPELIDISERDFGTGYPGDPKSKQFLSENKDNVFGFPNFVRFSWSTADKLLDEVAQVEWDNDDKSASENQNISNFFSSLGPSGEKKHKVKCRFFKDRSLCSADKF